MKIDSNDSGDIIVTFTEDEAREIVADAVFNDADAFTVTSKFRDVVQRYLDENDLDDLDDDDLDGDDDEDDELDP